MNGFQSVLSKSIAIPISGYILNWCSAFTNPFIYVFTNEMYRASFQRALKKKLGHNTWFTTWIGKGVDHESEENDVQL